MVEDVKEGKGKSSSKNAEIPIFNLASFVMANKKLSGNKQMERAKNKWN